MRITNKIIIVLAAASIVVVAAGETAAHAGEWSAWQRMSGIPVSFRYVQVNSDTCALAFRNDSGIRLMGAKLEYIHDGRVDHDYLPGLNPGQALGGWTAFSFEGNCANSQVRIYDAQWQQ